MFTLKFASLFRWVRALTIFLLIGLLLSTNPVLAATQPSAIGTLNKSQPANGAKDQPVSLLLRWDANSNTANYEYCIDTIDNHACDATWLGTDTANFATADLVANTAYYWQVRAIDGSDVTYSDNNTWWAFTTGPASLFSRKASAVKSSSSAANENRMGASAAELTSTNVLQDPSFEASYEIYPYWDQYSLNYWTPLCTTADCGNGIGTAGPRTGSVWAWFGGTYADEDAYVSQDVFFPGCRPTLQFYFWIGRAEAGSGSDDDFAVWVDNTLVFSANATQQSYYPTYTLISVDVSSFANAMHTLWFTSSTTGQLVTFNLDDVSLIGGNCTLSGTTGVAETTLSYTDGAPQTAKSLADGSYSLPVSSNWTGMVTPYHPCFTFSPANKSYSNVVANQTAQNYLPTFNPSSGCTDIEVLIAEAPRGRFGIQSQSSAAGSYAGTLDGPVKVVSTNAEPFVTSQRVVFGNSFNELMGYPVNRFTTEYWFPWYDMVYMNTWVLVGNPSATQTAYVNIYIGGVKQNNSPYIIPPGDRVVPQFPGVLDGPVRVVSVTGVGTPTPLPIFASERSTYLSSFNEVMGYPADQFTTEYWFPWYDQVYMNSWVLVGNPSTTQTAYVDIYIGGVKQNDTYSIPPSGRVVPQFPGVLNGPVRVVSVTGTGTPTPLPIFASERSTYQGSFNEVMGYPANQFATEYWYTWYDNLGMASWVLVGNPSTTQTAYVDIYIAGVKQGSTFVIPPSGSVIPRFNLSSGPVRVVSVTGAGTPTAIPVFTSERSLYGPSFNEMMGYPADQLSSEYWFTWYDSIYMNTELYVSKP